MTDDQILKNHFELVRLFYDLDPLKRSTGRWGFSSDTLEEACNFKWDESIKKALKRTRIALAMGYHTGHQ